MTIQNINRQTLGEISDQLLAAMADTADALGLEVKRTKGTYGGHTGSLKFEIGVKDTGEGKSAAQAEFETWAQLSGIDPEAFGKNLLFQNKRYKLCGAYPSSPKYRFAGKCQLTGKTFKFTADAVRLQFPKAS